VGSERTNFGCEELNTRLGADIGDKAQRPAHREDERRGMIVHGTLDGEDLTILRNVDETAMSQRTNSSGRTVVWAGLAPPAELPVHQMRAYY
jgi:hypothetical protein